MTQADLPLLARVLACVILHKGKLRSGISMHTGFIRLFSSSGEEISILKEDWAKVSPFIEDGTFDPMLFPYKVRGVVPRHPNIPSPLVDVRARGLYDRIIGVLTPLFPEVPTSDL